MKTTIQELSNETITTSSGVSTVQGKRWLQSILAAAKQKMFFEQFAYVTDAGAGIKDVAVPIAASHVDFTDDTTQASRTYTEITTINTVTFTPSTHKFGAAISDDVIRTSQVDIVAYARDEIAYDMALNIDVACATAIGAATPATTLYGGDASSVATLETGDVMTTDLVASGIRALKVNGWVAEADKPLVLFISPYQEEAFMKDSQFTNAAEYGNNEVVMNGEIGKYLGVKVISTNQVPAKTITGHSWGANGHQCFLLKAKVAYGIVYGLRPRLDWEYKKDVATHNIYLDVAYAADSIQDNSIVFIDVTDA